MSRMNKIVLGFPKQPYVATFFLEERALLFSPEYFQVVDPTGDLLGKTDNMEDL